MANGEITAEEQAANGDDSPIFRQMRVVDAVASTPIKTAPFQLPPGWTVKKVLRSGGIGEDKLYYKRRVRKKVIPLIADEKYFPRPKHKYSIKALEKGSDASSPGARKYAMSGGNLMKLHSEKLAANPHSKAATSPFNLPDGWVVKEVPRGNTSKRKDSTYKVYYEPGTGRQFRSLLSVKKHLAEDTKEDKPLSEMFNKLESEKTNSRKKATSSTFGPPPARIKWVLTDDDSGESGDLTFKPSIGESMVADHVVQQWTDRFMMSINGKNCNPPKF